MSDQELKKKFANIKQKIDDEDDGFDTIKFNDETRSKIGKIFVWGFFIAIFGSILLTMLYNFIFYSMTHDADMMIKLESVLTLLGSVIGVSLGFVMGYYFKTDRD